MGHAAGVLLILLAQGLRLAGDLLGSVSDLMLALAAVVVFVFLAGWLDTKKPPAKLPAEMPSPPVPAGNRRPEVALDIPARTEASGDGKGRGYQDAAVGVKNQYQQYLETKQQRASLAAAAEEQAEREKGQESLRPALAFTPDAMVNAVIYAEVLGRPKAYQNRRR